MRCVKKIRCFVFLIRNPYVLTSRGVELSRTQTVVTNVADNVTDTVSTDTASTLPLHCLHNFGLAGAIFSDLFLIGFRFYKGHCDLYVVKNFL
jgi:acyl-CoA synthetase (AMP-forming)/AMP-acid ligase II